MNETDETLVLKSQRKDRAAFEELVRRTARLVYSRVYLDTGDRHQAEDLVQETFMVAWRSITQVTDASGFRAWLLSIAKTVTLDAQRRQSRKKRADPSRTAVAREIPAVVADPRPGPYEKAESADERHRVLEILRRLPAEYREPLLLRYLGGADYDTIGQQLGLTNGSLRGLLIRGMARLREELKE